MAAVAKLLDNAVKACSPANQSALATRLDVSPQQISRWRHGHDPVPPDQIARLARIAHLDAGEWVVLIEAEQAKGEARKAYTALVKRLGIAALLAIATAPAMAYDFAYSGPVVLIMSTVRKLVTRLLRTLQRRRSLPHAALLAL